jgi:phage FluMu gp28-like protein
MGSSQPAVPLTEYQINWVNDKSRFKIGVITRQGGKSFEAALDAVDDGMSHKTMWVILSAGERQSKEVINKCAMHARAYGMAIQELEYDFIVDKDTKYKQLEIILPNGTRIIGLPANPDTARGWSANIILDEFALHKDSREIWKALFPTVTRGYKIRVISTFKGKTNKFYELFFGAPTLQRYNGKDYEYVGDKGGWSKHFVSISQAVEMGLKLVDEQGKPCEPEDLRLALNDDDAWEEEYMCVPSDEVSAFLTHDMISSCEDVKVNASPEWVSMLIKAAETNYIEYKRTKIAPPLPLNILENVTFLGELFAGMDIGRRHDLSVIWLDQKINNVLNPVAIIELRRQPFFVQMQVLHTLLALQSNINAGVSLHILKRIDIDETGIGAQLVESAQDVFGSSRVEGISFTPESKETLAVGLKQNLEDHGSVLPASSTVRNSLHSVKKYATTTKHFRFDAERTEATGHADHFWAKALSVQAASSNVVAVCIGQNPSKHESPMGRSGISQHKGGFFGRFSQKITERAA